MGHVSRSETRKSECETRDREEHTFRREVVRTRGWVKTQRLGILGHDDAATAVGCEGCLAINPFPVTEISTFVIASSLSHVSKPLQTSAFFA